MAILAIGGLPTDVPQRPQNTRKASSKLGSAFKRAGRYLKDQASEQNNYSALYLSPARPEPQQRITTRSAAGDINLDDHIDSQLAQKLTALNYYSRHNSSIGTSPPAYIASSQRSSASAKMSSATGPGIFKDMKRHQYASENILQSYDVLVPERGQSSESKQPLWLVYTHGGYFRDPKVDSISFKPAIEQIESSHTGQSSLKSRISGYASLNYRLSPHPGHPQNPDTTPSYELNKAHWPDQPLDVQSALHHLQNHYPESKNYILIGHSVGATLAFLAALQCAEAGVVAPQAVVGVSGIYDFVDIHRTNPDYEVLTKNAMDPAQYSETSPALYSAETYRQKWKADASEQEDEDRVVVLAHSRDDGLVVWDQLEEMERVFKGQRGFKSELVELKGKHNEIWEQGAELVRAIQHTLELVSL